MPTETLGRRDPPVHRGIPAPKAHKDQPARRVHRGLPARKDLRESTGHLVRKAHKALRGPEVA